MARIRPESDNILEVTLMNPQQSIAHYRIISKLGEGGMGTVYRATDTKLNREVAIKVLPPAFAEDAARMARFEREAQVLASLSHPNIAAIYGIEQGAIVMELVEGKDLHGPLPVDTALEYARQIAAGLGAAHEKGIVHRDLKPANVKVTPDGQIKLLDFGLAKSTEPTTVSTGANPTISPTLSLAMTQAGMILGTAAYMSPEQARGKPVDKRADIWAFGVVLYELLSGEQPFANGETISDVIAAVLTREPDLSRVPGQVRALLAACLEKDPRQRLRDIGDWQRLLGSIDPATIPATSRNRAAWMAAGAFALVAAVAGWKAWLAAPAIDRPLIRFTVELGPDAVAGSRQTAAISPDGRRLVYSARTVEGHTQLATRLLDQPKGSLLSGTEDGDDAFFSPDGKWIAFVADEALKKTSVLGGAVTKLCDVSPFRGAWWSPDGYILASPRAQMLVRIPESGGTPQPVTRNRKESSTHRWPQILPGGQHALFTSHGGNSDFDEADLATADLATGAIHVVRKGGYFARYLPTGHLIYLRQGILYGVRFNLAKLEAQGDAVALVEDVAGGSVGARFDFSQTGTLLYRPGPAGSGSHVWDFMDSSGKTQPLLATPGNYLAPRFSPDGRMMAMMQTAADGNHILLYDLARESLTRVDAGGASGWPAWAPDGKHIVYATPGFQAVWARADGAGEPVNLVKVDNIPLGMGISPDARWLVYSVLGSNGSSDVWALPLDASNPDRPKPGTPVALLQNSKRALNPALSPDGRWLAYSSDETGRFQVYVRPFANGALGPGRTLISNTTGKNPHWSPATRELLYEMPDHHVMTVPYTVAGDAFNAGKPRLWSETVPYASSELAAYWEIAPDGKRLAVLRPPAYAAETGPAHVVVLLNFFDEVKRRLP